LEFGLKYLFAAVLLALSTHAFAQTEVKIPARNPDGSALELNAFWFQTKAESKQPTILLLHGCGGPYNARGELSQRMREYTQLLNAQGYHALVLDSLTARGERELCTQKTGTRKVTQAHRRLDARAAFLWLAEKPEVDASRLALLGWSNGGSTVLASTDATARTFRLSPEPRAALAFYPGCEVALRDGYKPVGATMLLVGAADGWTPAAPCAELVKRNPQMQIQSYEGAFHNFDSTAPIRVRKEVPNGVNPGQGVTVGGNPEAKAASEAAMLKFFKEAFAR
jgi:dienelactone hydrolase